MRIETAEEREEKKEWLSSEERRLRRALHRFYLGKGIPGEYLLVTLSTPEWQYEDGAWMHRTWRKFTMRLRRRELMREYFAVREYNKRGTCEHLHVVFRAGYLPVEELREQWTLACGLDPAFHGYVWTHITRTYGGDRGVAAYLAKYLVKAIAGPPVGDDLGWPASSEALNASSPRKGDSGSDVQELPERASKTRAFWYAQAWMAKRAMTVGRALLRFGAKLESADLVSVRASAQHWFSLGLTAVSSGYITDAWELLVRQVQLRAAIEGKVLTRLEAARFC